MTSEQIVQEPLSGSGRDRSNSFLGGLMGSSVGRNLGLVVALLILCLVGIGLLIILVKWIENIATTYALTDERLIIRSGIFSKSIDEIELYRIKDIKIDFSLINQIAGIGRLTIASSDETTRDGDLVIAGIDRAQERRETLRRLVDAARQKRNVREIDMHPDAA
jgi:uncharacterized membrane protein YdbT with pleckstrin-like domain